MRRARLVPRRRAADRARRAGEGRANRAPSRACSANGHRAIRVSPHWLTVVQVALASASMSASCEQTDDPARYSADLRRGGHAWFRSRPRDGYRWARLSFYAHGDHFLRRVRRGCSRFREHLHLPRRAKRPWLPGTPQDRREWLCPRARAPRSCRRYPRDVAPHHCRIIAEFGLCNLDDCRSLAAGYPLVAAVG